MFMAGTVLATVKETIDDIQSKALGRLVVSPSRYFRRVIARFIANSVLTLISCELMHFPIAGAVQAAAGNGGPPTALGVVGTACMLTISYAIAHMAIRRLKSNGGLLHT
jgi:hypothetical protein